MTLPDPALQPEFYSDVPFKRAGAWAIDLVVTLALTLGRAGADAVHQRLFPAASIRAVSVAYRTVMLARYGATLGMMVMALKWRHLNGRAPDATTALIYSSAHAVMWTLFPLQIVSIALILMSSYRQGLHDHLLSTTMLHKIAPNDRYCRLGETKRLLVFSISKIMSCDAPFPANRAAVLCDRAPALPLPSWPDGTQAVHGLAGRPCRGDE